MAGDEGVQRLGEPGIQRDRPRAVGARQLGEAEADVGVPQDLQAQLLAVHAADVDQSRRGRIAAVLHHLQAPLGGDVQVGRALSPQRLRRRRGERREQPAVVLDRAIEQRLGHRAGERLEHQPAAPVIAHGAHRSDPALLDGDQPFRHLGAGRQLREALERLGDLHRRPVGGRRGPFAAVPVKAAVGDRPAQLDERAVVGKREDDGLAAVAVGAQLDVGAVGDELHGGWHASGPARRATRRRRERRRVTLGCRAREARRRRGTGRRPVRRSRAPTSLS